MNTTPADTEAPAYRYPVDDLIGVPAKLYVWVFPLVVGVVVWVGWMMTLLGLLYDDTGPAGLTVLLLLALLAGAHLGMVWWGRRRGGDRPWELPVVVTAALVMTTVVAALAVVIDPQGQWRPIIVVLGHWAAVQVAVMVWVRAPSYRWRMVFALGVVAVLLAGVTGLIGAQAARERARQRVDLARVVGESAQPIAVVEHPDWVLETVWASENDERFTVLYAPRDGEVAEEGFRLHLRTEPT
ncbi:hypothetical protein, partial [Nocardiopsis sp. MG754419]|uniref:hypothetical protein n=1 Tax=Nocardiopsis sp. MG754419 TaxID=2259865 RepID=UPI001BA89E63